MAFKWTEDIVTHGPKVPMLKMVLLALANRASVRGVVLVTYAELARDCGLKSKTVAGKVRILKDEGWIQVKTVRDRLGTFNRYRLNNPKTIAARLEPDEKR